jgi:hypothetical protein
MLAPMVTVGSGRGRSLLAWLAVLAWAAAAAAAPPAFTDAHGIHVEAVASLSERQLNVHVATAALDQAVDVRILLPAGYADAPRAFPVLYLFRGTSGRAADWVDAGDAEAATAGLPLIVVMPDGGYDGDGGGRFADWSTAAPSAGRQAGHDARQPAGPGTGVAGALRQPASDPGRALIRPAPGRNVSGLTFPRATH